jgi:hypothetical protein
MDFVTLTKDERCHLWVPVTGLVTEMHACFEHLAHRYFAHLNLRIRVKPPRILLTHRLAGTQIKQLRYVCGIVVLLHHCRKTARFIP